ncbi:hypothetical protein ACS3YM_16145 [Nocardia sp. N13]|uniref:hypothetical protein n=1 Tax=Nocardioides sp. N13(2025) TaxID=3453405 RepID=UPI003F75FCCC
MKNERNAQVSDLTGRLKELEHFTGALVRREPEPEAIPVDDAPLTLVPVPRRSRIFLRSGGGHGVFADLTLTAPLPRAVTD